MIEENLYQSSTLSFLGGELQKNEDETKPRILVVDDEDKVGRFICMLLKRSGYETFSCRSAAEARTLIVEKKWDLILTDIVMPKENGFELVRWIGEHHRKLPVIVMTAHSTDAVENQSIKLGVASILHKPFTIDGLRIAVSQIIELNNPSKNS